MSPPKKIRKTEEQSVSSTEGVIRFEVDNISTLDYDGRFSTQIEVAGVPWKMVVAKETVDNQQCLHSYLISMPNQSTLWSIVVNAEHILIHSDSSKNIVEKMDNTTFNHASGSWGNNLIEWKDLMNEKKGFVKNDKITVKIWFTIVKMRGFRTVPRVDFADPNDPRNDLALVIEGEKIYVNKGMLAFHSPVLNATFYGNFDEKDKKEIELTDVDRKEFIVMLRLIYPTDQKVTDDNVSFLLKLGDFYQIKLIIDLCEAHLISSEAETLASKLLLSDQYRLIELQNHCLEQLNDQMEVKAIKEAPEYADISDATKVALLEKMFQLLEEEE